MVAKFMQHGGEQMAKETVQAIKNAELSAAKLENEANRKKEEILLTAQQDAKKLISSMTNEMQEKAGRDMAETVQRSKAVMEAARLNAEKEIELLKEMVKSKEQAAIDLVISNVI